MQSYVKSNSHNRSLVKDFLGVLLMLVIGVGGLILVSDPVKILIPRHPMISPQDWAGGHAVRELQVSSKNWAEYRILEIRLNSDDDKGPYFSQVKQWAKWYVDEDKAADKWDHQYSSDWTLINENFITADKPASRLSCVSGASVSPYRVFCDFEAYRGHWWTQILFSSFSDEQLSDSEIQHIIDQANQLLMTASVDS
jgi:hypothetical protein